MVRNSFHNVLAFGTNETKSPEQFHYASKGEMIYLYFTKWQWKTPKIWDVFQLPLNFNKHLKNFKQKYEGNYLCKLLLEHIL